MCGRYYIAENDLTEELVQIIEEVNRKKIPEGLKTSGEIFPSDIVPVLANSRQQNVQPFAMRWGYAFPNGRPIINARSETAATKPMFKDGMRQRRCLIPATNYFEWERHGVRKTKYAIRPAHSKMLYLAGIYHLEKHKDLVTPVFTILTRDAAPGIAFIHPRMPIILPASHASVWLDHSNEAEEIVRAALSDMEYTLAKPLVLSGNGCWYGAIP